VITNRGKEAEAVNSLVQPGLDPQYTAFFERFNQQLFYEAHEVLEPLWLAQRKEPDGAFYKGLIQLAGAFVHLQKRRRQPAVSLLRLAQSNLRLYPALHHRLDLAVVLDLIEDWQGKLEADSLGGKALLISPAPKLHLRQS
jgi:predicted metal-dependent hydrolase